MKKHALKHVMAFRDRYLAAIILLLSVSASAQYNPRVNSYGNWFTRLKTDSAQHIPMKTSMVLNDNDTTPQVFVLDSANLHITYKLIFYAHGSYYSVSGGNASKFDSTYWANLINTLLPIVDTASMLSPYARANTISNLLNLQQVVNLGSAYGIKAGTYSLRPSATNSLTVYIAVDSGRIYYDNGGWVGLGGSGSGGGSITDSAFIANYGLSATRGATYVAVNVDTSKIIPYTDTAKVNGIASKSFVLANVGGGGPPSGSAGGDLGGTYPNPTVQGWKGVTLSGTLSSHQTFVNNGSNNAATNIVLQSDSGMSGLYVTPKNLKDSIAAHVGGTTTNSLTFNNGGSGASSGTTFNGGIAQTISYNTIGANPLISGTGYSKWSGTTPIFITSIPNTDLANSTISGVSLGSNLFSHTVGYGLSGSSFNGSSAQAWAVDTTNIVSKTYFAAHAGGGGLSAISNLRYLGNVSGSSAIPTSLFYSVYNVLDFGLVNDSATDNTAALRTLLNTIPAYGARLYFPGGKGYIFSDTVTINKSVYMYGDGLGNKVTPVLTLIDTPSRGGTTFYFTSNTKKFMTWVSSTTNKSPTIELHDISIYNVASSTPVAGCVAINIDSNIIHPMIMRCTIDGFYTNVANISSVYATIEESTISTPVFAGIVSGDPVEPDNGGGMQLIRSRLLSGIQYLPTYGIQVLTGGNLRILDNFFNSRSVYDTTHQFKYPIYMDWSQGATSIVQVMRNTIENYRGVGIYAINLSGSGNIPSVNFSDNHIGPYNPSSTTYGIYLKKYQNGVVEGNDGINAYTSPNSFIRIDSCSNMHIGLNTQQGWTGATDSLYGCSNCKEVIETNSASVAAINNGVTGSYFAAYPFSGTGPNLQIFNSYAAPSIGYSIGLEKPGNANGNDMVFAGYVSSWNEWFRIKSTGYLNAAGYGSGTKTGTVAYLLGVDASHNIIETSGGGGGTPGGSSGQMQVNSSGSFAGTPGLTYNTSTDVSTFTKMFAVSPTSSNSLLLSPWTNTNSGVGAGIGLTMTNDVGTAYMYTTSSTYSGVPNVTAFQSTATGQIWLYTSGKALAINNSKQIQFPLYTSSSAVSVTANAMLVTDASGNVGTQALPSSNSNFTINAAQTAGTSFTASAGVTNVNPSTLVSSMTITMPASPNSGDEVTLLFGGTIAAGSQVITTTTISPNSGQSIYGSLTYNQSKGGDAVTYKYIGSNTWFRTK